MTNSEEAPTWLEIDNAYSAALEYSCTCGEDDANCSHCASWEHARALLKQALAASQSEADQRDAAKYRWLRDRTCVADGVFRCFEADKLQLILGNSLTGSQRLDAAIDAAMRQSAPDGSSKNV